MGIIKNVKVKVISDGELKQLSVILKAIPKPSVFNDAKDCKALSEANKNLQMQCLKAKKLKLTYPKL